VKRSAFKPKLPLTPAQQQIKDETRRWKREVKLLAYHNSSLKKAYSVSNSRTGARGQYYKGEWIPSQWQLECLKLLELRETAGEILDLQSQVDISYTVYNEAGETRSYNINVDFCFFDKNINRHCRWDAKPPKVVHTKSGRKYPQKIHAEWNLKFDQLKFCQPDYDYRILIKGNCYYFSDLNLTLRKE